MVDGIDANKLLKSFVGCSFVYVLFAEHCDDDEISSLVVVDGKQQVHGAQVMV
jgi:hypothetical protein